MEALKDSLKFRQWKGEMEKHGNVLHNVEDLHTVRKRNGEVLFSMIKMQADSPEGNPLLPIALLRGHFVAVLVALIEEETGQEYHLLVRQRRVATGALFFEHPAGMCDSETDPWAIALIEVEEETSLKVTREDLTLLTPQPLYSSPGLLDEGGYFFCCRLTMPAAEIQALHEKEAGTAGEYIHTFIATPEESRHLIKAANGVLLYFLYQEWLGKQ
ncbi:MAG: NUDIX domain-containing protein [Bacteroidota bacterium]